MSQRNLQDQYNFVYCYYKSTRRTMNQRNLQDQYNFVILVMMDKPYHHYLVVLLPYMFYFVYYHCRSTKMTMNQRSLQQELEQAQGQGQDLEMAMDYLYYQVIF